MAKNDLAEFQETHNDLIQFSEANISRMVEVITIDGEKHRLVIDNVDNEGFVSTMEGESFWMAFDSVQDYTTLPD